MSVADSKRDRSFSEVFSAFLDATDDPELSRESRPAEDEALMRAIEACARRLTKDDATRVEGLQMLRIASSGFLHGIFYAGPFMGSFFYFEKDQQGLLAFSRFGGATFYTRITMTTLPNDAVFVPRPRNRPRAS